MSDNQYVYLHGFASGPESYKAQFFRQCFQDLGLTLAIPDFNRGGFQQLTLSRQLQQLEQLSNSESITLIGSSLGGLTATCFAENYSRIKRLVLLAPAFDFLEHWLPTFPPMALKNWSTGGTIEIFHHGTKKTLPLNYTFVSDLKRYDTQVLQRKIPTLIMHGVNDQTIPLSASERYAETREWVNLIRLQSDHSLSNVLDQMWRSLSDFLQLESSTTS
ncbi:MAG: YqiA/YcfP family alpha/beta fold hydrolase [Cyanobacteria bacterium P01_F01_bin.42]